jgi:hypothetical protein
VDKMSKSEKKQRILNYLNENLTMAKVIAISLKKIKSKNSGKIKCYYKLVITPEDQIPIFYIKEEIQGLLSFKFNITIV